MDYSKERDEFCNSANSRETSLATMVTVAKIARDIGHAERIWEEPTDDEIQAICETLENPPASYCWGAAGSDWL